MMTLYKSRKKLKGSSQKIGKTFGFMSANTYTGLGLLFSLATAYFLITGQFIIAAVLFLIASFFDAIDGAVARYRKEATNKGAYIDTIVDRYSEAIVILALMLVVLPSFYFPSFFWAGLYLFGSMMTTYAKAAAAEKRVQNTSGGLGRPDRVIVLFLGILFTYFDPLFLTHVIALLAVLTNITALHRIKKAMK